ncbi:cupin domain-containing protein [Albimonas sp. CAU 1670]|uniref:cupin domain-containing protein n=1 Tax=Albimonas sp. CAU 1670 TaxID=3032599 RepID=UPI0023DA4D32|nr:cupin domain-containing protein [Albimonas sp. CAU 1670]MDF2231947.1 cupin domain-containing protein [Albimonas sp. CAU 1670]
MTPSPARRQFSRPGAARLAAALPLALAPLLAGPASAQDAYPPLEPLLSTEVDVLGAPIAWPEGKAQTTAAIVTMKPGEATGLHRHEAPMFAWVMQGEITVSYQDAAKTVRTYRAGEAIVEAHEVPHRGVNSGEVPVRILVVFSGAEGLANTVSLPD